MVIVNKLICPYVVGKGGRYMFGTWSVRDRYVVGKPGQLVYYWLTWMFCPDTAMHGDKNTPTGGRPGATQNSPRAPTTSSKAQNKGGQPPVTVAARTQQQQRQAPSTAVNLGGSVPLGASSFTRPAQQGQTTGAVTPPHTGRSLQNGALQEAIINCKQVELQVGMWSVDD